MKERPILFQREMVRAILAGEKTQTRRPVLPQPVDQAVAEAGDSAVIGRELVHIREPRDRLRDSGVLTAAEFKCPYGVAGDRLWVKETWKRGPVVHFPGEKGKPEDLFSTGYCYAADLENPESLGPWLSGRFMPRSACRLMLFVVGTHFERVQEIGPADAAAEGIPPGGFAAAWDQMYAAKGLPWSLNPLVWVISFERICDE